MESPRKLLLIDERSSQSAELEIILALAGYEVEVRTNMLVAMNLYGLLNETSRAFDIVLVVCENELSPELGYFKTSGNCSLIALMTDIEPGRESCRHDEKSRICQSYNMLEVLDNCSLSKGSRKFLR